MSDIRRRILSQSGTAGQGAGSRFPALDSEGNPVEITFALLIDSRYDGNSLRVFLLGPIYPIFFWLVSACAALRAEIPALCTGPAERRVV